MDLTRDKVYLTADENRYQAFFKPPVCVTLSEKDRYILNRLKGILGCLKDYEHIRGGSLNEPHDDRRPHFFLQSS